VRRYSRPPHARRSRPDAPRSTLHAPHLLDRGARGAWGVGPEAVRYSLTHYLPRISEELLDLSPCFGRGAGKPLPYRSMENSAKICGVRQGLSPSAPNSGRPVTRSQSLSGSAPLSCFGFT